MLVVLMAVFVFALGVFQSSAQTVTGQISGTVTDPTGAVIAGAKVALTNTVNGQARDVVTDQTGSFIIPELVPGNYQITVTANGFQTYNQKDISLAASERVALHQIQLPIGNVSTEVTVTANQAHVETDSSEHSGLVSSTQVSDVTVKGRNYLSYVALLPGVNTTGQSDAPGWGSTDGLTFNGGDNTVLIQLDGIASQDNGINGATAYIAPSADAIGEMKVQTGNMNAEYGARNGGTINVIIKNGTRDFHGTLYDYERNNMFNANTYFNKRSTNPAIANHPASYKYHNPGGTIGGPVVIPGVAFNKNRDKLFFFFSADILRRSVPVTGGFGLASAPATFTMPTAAERNGNFSADVLRGVRITCPGGTTALTAAQAANLGTACPGFAPWVIPGTTTNPILNVLPLPQASCGVCTGTDNWQNILNSPQPRSDFILRGDYNITKNELWYVRLIKDYQAANGSNFLGGSGFTNQLLTSYQIHSSGAVSTLVSTIRPNLVNEFTAGVNRALQTIDPWDPTNFNSNVRTNVSLGPTVLPVLFPDPSSPFGANAQSSAANPSNLIPNATFASGTSLTTAPSLNIEGRFPFFGTDTTYNITDNITWVKAAHALKFGFYWEKNSRNGPPGGNGAVGTAPFNSNFNGTLNFGQTAQSTNPNDTGFSFSNAYLGVFQTYTELSLKQHGYDRWHNVEWFAQDTWKVTRRLTLDYGVRFQWLTPTYDVVPVADFRPDVYNPAAQAPLIQPCLVGGVRKGCFGAATFPVGAIGSFAPASLSGVQPFQGMVTYAPREPVVNTPSIAVGPRVGFAWDIFGNGKTALRGGYGMFYNRFGNVDTVGQLVQQPPLVTAPFIFDATVPQLLAAPTTALLSPQTVIGLPRNFKSPATYAYNLDVQRDLGHGLLLDVAYVGNQGRHNGESLNTNLLPYGADFRPTAVDSTNGRTLPASVLRSTPGIGRQPGYGDVLQMFEDVNSNYNALQVQVNKRFGRALTMNAAWTWAKILDYAPPAGANRDPNVPAREYYGVGANYREHNFTANWTYNFPNSHFSNAFAKAAVNGWVWEGIFTYVTGAPVAVNVNPTYDLTGASGTAVLVRPNVVGNPYTNSGGPNFLNTAAFTAPTGGAVACGPSGTFTNCGVGNAAKYAFFASPTNNWNMSVFKNFQLGKSEARTLQIRWETYNTFNHTQFGNQAGGGFVSTTVNTASPGASTFNNFGVYNTTAPARVMVFAAKFRF